MHEACHAVKSLHGVVTEASTHHRHHGEGPVTGKTQTLFPVTDACMPGLQLDRQLVA